MSQRLDRLADLVRAELAVLLQREVRDPRVGLATVTRVDLSRDLGHAVIHISAARQRGAAHRCDRRPDARPRLPAPGAGASPQPAHDAGAQLRPRPRRRAQPADQPTCSTISRARGRMVPESLRDRLAAAPQRAAHQPRQSRRRRDRLRARPGACSCAPWARACAIWNLHRTPTVYRAAAGGRRHPCPARRPRPAFPRRSTSELRSNARVSSGRASPRPSRGFRCSTSTTTSATPATASKTGSIRRRLRSA